MQRQARTTLALTFAVATVMLFVGSCSQHLGPIFGPVGKDLAWPPPPAKARIRYIGQLKSEADLKARPKPFEALGAFFLGAKEPARLYGPRSATCIDGSHRLWVADPGGRCVHIFDMQQRTYKKITRAGTRPLVSPVDVCTGPAGSIFVCDSQEAAVHRLSAADGALQETLRMPEDVRRPAAVCYMPSRGELFVVDVSAHDIKVLTPRGGLLRIIGGRGDAPGRFNFPCDAAVDGDTIWVADTGNARIQQLSAEGAALASIGQSGDAPGDFALPKGIALDSDGHIYVVDARFENVQIFDRSGDLLLFFGEEGTGPGEFWLPAGISIDGLDRVWVCDSYNGRLQVFQYITETDPLAPAPGQVNQPALGNGATSGAESPQAVNR